MKIKKYKKRIIKDFSKDLPLDTIYITGMGGMTLLYEAGVPRHLITHIEDFDRSDMWGDIDPSTGLCIKSFEVILSSTICNTQLTLSPYKKK